MVLQSVQSNLEKKPTHLVVSSNLEKPKEFYDLKSASDWCDNESKQYPGVSYSIYQLRAEIVGIVSIQRNDYSN